MRIFDPPERIDEGLVYILQPLKGSLNFKLSIRVYFLRNPTVAKKAPNLKIAAPLPRDIDSFRPFVVNRAKFLILSVCKMDSLSGTKI